MLELVYSIVVFLLVLSFLVIIHEFGHFLSARLFGVKVEEFGLGYPPKVKDMFTKWGTVFTLNWLPFGGFVRLAGEERHQEEKTSNSSNVFYNKPLWQRIIILTAGAAVNFIFGIIAFSIIFTIQGIPEVVPLEQGVLITGITQNSPAQEVGLRPGDVILSYDDGSNTVHFTESEQLIEFINQNRGNAIAITVDRGDTPEVVESEHIDVYARNLDEISNPDSDGAIGILIDENTLDFVHYAWWQMPFRGAYTGMVSAINFGLAILLGIGSMFKNIFVSGVLPQEVAGPVGIAREVYQQKIFQGGIFAILNFASVISINLAIVNLLPVPALDGGRIVVITLEKLMGKAFKPAYEQYANLIGFIFLLSLIILITIKDVGVIITDIGIGF